MVSKIRNTIIIRRWPLWQLCTIKTLTLPEEVCSSLYNIKQNITHVPMKGGGLRNPNIADIYSAKDRQIGSVVQLFGQCPLLLQQQQL